MDSRLKSKVKVIIIGDGPAGISAGLTLLKSGVSPFIFSGSNSKITFLEPLQSLSPDIYPLIKKLGLENCLLQSCKATYKSYYLNGKKQVFKNGCLGYHINKSSFAELSRDQLENKYPDVVIRDPIKSIEMESNDCKVSTKSGKSFRSEFIIDASGKKKIVGSTFGLKQKSYSKPLISWTGISVLPNSQSQILKTSFISDNNGWVWIAPECDGQFSWSRLMVNPKAVCPQPFDARPIVDPRAYSVKWRVFRPVCHKNLLLTGDAAGTTDPSTGLGISNALLSGYMAASCLISSFQFPHLKNTFFAKYDQWFIESFEEKAILLNQTISNYELFL